MPTSSLTTPRDRRNYQQFTLWMAGAMLTFATATLLIDGGLIPDVVGWVLTATTTALMVAAIVSYTNFLRNADELLRKIHIEALAVAFGAGIVAMMGYRLCERLGAPKLDVNDPAFGMLLVWIGGQLLGARRFAVPEEEV